MKFQAMSDAVDELSNLIEKYEAKNWDSETLARFVADVKKILDCSQCKESRALLSK